MRPKVVYEKLWAVFNIKFLLRHLSVPCIQNDERLDWRLLLWTKQKMQSGSCMIYGKHICGEVLPRDWITKTACVTIITQARGALLWRSRSFGTMRKGQRDAPILNGIPTIECQVAHCILSNNKWQLQKSLVQLHYLNGMEMNIIQL